MTKSTKKTNAKFDVRSIVYPIELKKIIGHAIDDGNIINHINIDKKCRSKIRANARAIDATKHIKHATYIIYTREQYDAIRCAFDHIYSNACEQNAQRERERAKQARAQKRNAKTRATTTTTNENASTSEQDNA